jgi:hypothetical protein
VVDIGQHVKYLVMVRHGGVWAQTALDLVGQNLEIYSLPAGAAPWSGQSSP